MAMDGKTELRMLSYEASKIGVVRSLCVDQSDMMQHCVQVLDLGIFPRPEIDLPIFCANFFTTASMSIIVLDLDLLHDVINQRDYKEKYYKHLIPLGLKYAEVRFELMDKATEKTRGPQIMCNLEAQRRYPTWRAEKDPDYQVLTRLIGDTRAKGTIRNFIFNGFDELGSKTFLNYFPEYECGDGTINWNPSMIGKSFESRPWELGW